MSEHSRFEFQAKPENRDNIERFMRKYFDAFKISLVQTEASGYNRYSLVVHELDLKESLALIDKVQEKYKNLTFIVNYGVYYR